MTQRISIRLSEKLKADMDELIRREGGSWSSVIQAALRQYLFLRSFRAIRRELIPYAEAQGIYSDDDVLPALAINDELRAGIDRIAGSGGVDAVFSDDTES